MGDSVIMAQGILRLVHPALKCLINAETGQLGSGTKGPVVEDNRPSVFACASPLPLIRV